MENPEFYGYIPDGGGRTLVFAFLLLNSSLLLLIRCLSGALLVLMGSGWFMLYMAVDMGLYLVQKVARGDFHHWIHVEGVLGFFVSLVMRVIVKVVVDYTGLVQFRAVGELGGAYWTCNTCMTLVCSFASVWVFFEYGDGRVVVGEGVIWKLVAGLVGGWLIVFGAFLKTIKKEYRSSFVDLDTGATSVRSFFFKAKSDEVRGLVFMINPKIWRSIRTDVAEWVAESYWKWAEDKPDWFDSAFRGSLPDDMIPEEARGAGGGGEGYRRRRSSLDQVKIYALK